MTVTETILTELELLVSHELCCFEDAAWQKAVERLAPVCGQIIAIADKIQLAKHAH